MFLSRTHPTKLAFGFSALLGVGRRRLAGRTQTRRFAPQTVRPADRSNPALLDSLEEGVTRRSRRRFQVWLFSPTLNLKARSCAD